MTDASFGVYFNDGTGAKMDYYVKRTAQLVKQCTGTEYGEVKVRITSTNTAPVDAATSLPAYVTGGGIFGVPPGSVQTNVIAYGPSLTRGDGRSGRPEDRLHREPACQPTRGIGNHPVGPG